MREIKLRAWDKYAKKMIFDFVISQYNKFSGWSNCIYCGLKVGSGGSDDYTLMQYTGLKDKNGVEIYEGDVVREDSPPHHCGEIKYDGGAFYISGITDGYSELCHILVDDFWEVVGNTHENPELIQEIK